MAMDQTFEEEDEVIYDKTSLLRRAVPQPKPRRPGSRGQPSHLWRVLSLTLLFTSLGVSLAIPGPTITCFEHLTHSADPLVSCLFAGRAGGILVASLLTHLLLDIVPADCLSVVGLLLLSVANFLIPWSERVWWLVGSFALQGATIGLTLSAALALTRSIFGRRHSPYRHTFLFALAVGCALAPILVMPFQLKPGEVNSPAPPRSLLNSSRVRVRRQIESNASLPPGFKSTAFPASSVTPPTVPGEKIAKSRNGSEKKNEEKKKTRKPPVTEKDSSLVTNAAVTDASFDDSSTASGRSSETVIQNSPTSTVNTPPNLSATSSIISSLPSSGITSMSFGTSPPSPTDSSSPHVSSTLPPESPSASPTSSPTPLLTPSTTPTPTPSPTSTPTPTPSPTSTPTPTPSPTTTSTSTTSTTSPTPIIATSPTTTSTPSTTQATSNPTIYLVWTPEVKHKRRRPSPTLPTPNSPPRRRRPSLNDRYGPILNQMSELRPVQRIFVALGVLSLVTFAFCLHLCCVCRRQEPPRPPTASAAVATESPRLFGRRRLSSADLTFLGALLALFFAACGFEVTLGNWLYPWARVHLHWGPLPCLLLTAAFWAGLALGRLPLLAAVRCRSGATGLLLFLHLLLALAGCLLLLLLSGRPAALWGGAALCGFGVGPFRGAMTAWLEALFAAGELRWLSVLTLVASGAGEAILPVATAFAAAARPQALFASATAMAALGPLLFGLVAVMARLRPLGGRSAAGMQIHTPLLDEDEEELSPRGPPDSDPEDGSFALRKLRNGSATASASAASASVTTAAQPGPMTASPLLALEAEEDDELGLH